MAAGTRIVKAKAAGISAALVVLCLGAAAPTARSTASTLRHPSLIAFIAYGATDSGLYVVRPDGTRLRRLARGSELYWPTWSPDRRWIAFAGKREGDPERELYVVRADGTGLSRLTSTSGRVTTPAWSPDGGRIAFVLRDPPGMSVVSRAGGEPRVVESGWNPYFLSWSPDGREIVFEYGSPYGVSVRAVDVATGVVTGLARGYCPVWSPDGRVVAYVDYGSISLLFGGGNVGVPIATPPSGYRPGCVPAWSADGRKLAFVAHSDTRALLQTVRRNGSQLRTVARWESPSGGPCDDYYSATWSPDGHRLAFVRTTSSGGCLLEVVRASGAHPHLLRTPLPVAWPQWQPRKHG
jgi:Tol biopolymer transport system component